MDDKHESVSTRIVGRPLIGINISDSDSLKDELDNCISDCLSNSRRNFLLGNIIKRIQTGINVIGASNRPNIIIGEH
jgi:hypothetical protein